MKDTIQKTEHRLINGDARDLSFLTDESIHLVVTSPPYWNLKRYNENPDQLGHVNNYESFLYELKISIVSKTSFGIYLNKTLAELPSRISV